VFGGEMFVNVSLKIKGKIKVEKIIMKTRG